MKKYLLLLFILLISGCSFYVKNEKVENTNVTTLQEDVITLPEEPVYVDDNPIVVGLYQNGKLINDINVLIKDRTDIASFDVFFTNEENVGGTNSKKIFSKYASNYENIDKYKIGFSISFSVGDELINETITGPKDMYILAPYVFVYLYDDIHQPDGAWYSHVEEDDVKEDTIYSSIKLFGAESATSISSPIKLTVFTYDTDDDFDKGGIYRGNSKYSIILNR